MTAQSDPLAEALREALGPAYEIENELSGGGMSRVFVATERALNRKVVIKVLPPDVAAGVNRERFRREIQLAAQLQHPHIVPLLSAGDTAGVLYYTMPFIEGESLKHALAHGTRFSPREVIGILLDIVDALAYAHARGVIHRDVKPANVLRSGVHAVVADFGVAKALSASLPAVGMTTSGMAIGTPQYMAPEQLAGDPAADHRMDIYAVGLLGYELLTGAPTFAEQSPQATLAAQLTRNPEPLEIKRPDVPDPLARLLMRCLAKDPGSRPATAQAVRTELEEIVMPSGDYPPRRVATKRRPWLGISVVAAGVIALLAFLATRQGGESPVLVDTSSAVTSAPAGAIVPPVKQDSAALPPPAPVAVTPPPPPRVAVDSSGNRQASAPAARSTSGSGRRAGGGRARTALDSLADLVLLLRAQAPPEPIVRQPSPNSVSQAGLEERRNNMGPKRKALLVADTDSISRVVMTRLARVLDRDRFDVTVSDDLRGSADQDSLDAAAKAAGHDLVLAIQAPMRRDSSYSANVRLRDLTANPSFATSGQSRRIPRDSIAIAADTLVAQVVRRVAQMDRAPRAGVVDPEIRAFEERARDMGPPRRVVLWNHPPHDNLSVQEAGTSVMDALRAAIRGMPRFAPVPRDSTLDLLARSRNRETVLSALKADFMVSIAGNVSEDSVSWTITVRDAGAALPYRDRSFRSAAAPLSNPFAFVAITLTRVIAAMEQIDAAPRQAASSRQARQR